MANSVLLNNIDHKDLKVSTHHSSAFGDDINCVLTFPTEYMDMQKEYPILIKKDERGEYQSVAILGFAKGENLFLEGSQWNARYIPGMIAKGPFLIGFQRRESGDVLHRDTVIHVDLDHPRIDKSGSGEPVFLPHGGNSPYLERIAEVLRGLHEGMGVSKAMFAAFESMELLEPVAVDIDISESEQYKLSGYYTINEEKLKELDGPSLEKLNRAGFLLGAYLLSTSLSNMPRLIDMKNRKRAQAAVGAAQAS